MTRVLVLNNLSPEGLGLFGDKYQIGFSMAEPEGIIVRSAKVDTDTYPHLVAVARAGAGTNDISVGKATEKGVCVFNTPGANANSVNELVFIMLGLYARRIIPALKFTESLGGNDNEINAKVEKGKSQFVGFELARKTLGVIGLGKIGVLVANAGIEHGMDVVGYDAYPTLANMHQLSAKVVVVPRMEEVLSIADILSVHVPLSEKTRNLIGASQIASMKSGCILMNYARNGIYDNSAVLQALDAGKTDAYITDFPTKALLEHSRVICTPHLGASTDEAEEKCAIMAVRQLKNYLEYGIVANSVNFPVLEMFPPQGARTRLAVVNRDIPNMIAAITGIIGNAGVNIQAFTNESNGVIGYNLVDLGDDISDELAMSIRQLPNVLRVRALRFSE